MCGKSTFFLSLWHGISVDDHVLRGWRWAPEAVRGKVEKKETFEIDPHGGGGRGGVVTG